MKRTDFMKYLLGLAGFGVFVMRQTLYATAVDATGRVVAGHPLRWAVTGISLLAAVGILLSCRQETFPRQDLAAGLGHWAFALGIGAVVAANAAPMPGTLGLLWKLLGCSALPVWRWPVSSE